MHSQPKQSLYELSEELAQFESALSDADLLSDDDLDALLDNLIVSGERLEEKATGYLKLMRNLEYKRDIARAYVKLVQAEADRLRKTAQFKESLVERLRMRLAQAILSVGKVVTPLGTLSVQSALVVKVVDADALPASLCRIRREPDKDAIKRCLMEGERVEGAELVERVVLQVRNTN